MHPDVAYDVFTSTGSDNDWINLQKYTDSVGNIWEGRLGKVGNVTIIETPSVQFYANASNGAGAAGTVDVYPTYVFAKDAF